MAKLDKKVTQANAYIKENVMKTLKTMTKQLAINAKSQTPHVGRSNKTRNHSSHIWCSNCNHMTIVTYVAKRQGNPC